MRKKPANALTAELQRRGREGSGLLRTPLWKQVRTYQASAHLEVDERPDVIDPRAAVVAMDRSLPPERTVTYDSGHGRDPQ